MTAAGDVSDYDTAAQSTLVASMADVLGVAAVDVSLTVSAASVRLVFLVTVADGGAAAAVRATVASALPTATAASSILGASVLTAPTATTLDVSPPFSTLPPLPPSHSPPALPWGPPEAPAGWPSPSSPAEPQPPSRPDVVLGRENVSSSSDASVMIAVPAAVVTLAVLVAAVILLRRNHRRSLKKRSQQRKGLQLAVTGLKRGSSSWQRAFKPVGKFSLGIKKMKPSAAAEKATHPGHVIAHVLGADMHNVGSSAAANSVDPFQSPRGTCSVAPVITAASPASSAELTDVETPVRQNTTVTLKRNTIVTLKLTTDDATLSAPGAPPGAPPHLPTQLPHVPPSPAPSLLPSTLPSHTSDPVLDASDCSDRNVTAEAMPPADRECRGPREREGMGWVGKPQSGWQPAQPKSWSAGDIAFRSAAELAAAPAEGRQRSLSDMEEATVTAVAASPQAEAVLIEEGTLVVSSCAIGQILSQTRI